MKFIGELNARRYRVTVMASEPPGSFQDEETQWLYITKRYADGSIERQSIGIGMSHLDALLQLLNHARVSYNGRQAEFRALSVEQ